MFNGIEGWAKLPVVVPPPPPAAPAYRIAKAFLAGMTPRQRLKLAEMARANRRKDAQIAALEATIVCLRDQIHTLFVHYGKEPKSE